MSSLRPPGSGKRIRPRRVAAEILRDMPDILRRHIELPAEVMVSITDVEVSEDLSFAKVFFSLLGPHEAEMADTVARLMNAKKGVVRHEIAQRMVMRQHPDLRFVYDASPARAARIEELLKQVREQSAGEDGEER